VIVAVSTMRAQMSHTKRSRPPAGAVSCGSGARKERRRASMSCCHHCVCVCVFVCVCVCVCVCVVSVTVCGVTVFALSNTVTHRARGGLRAVGAPACRDSCAEFTNPTTWGVSNSYTDALGDQACRDSCAESHESPQPGAPERRLGILTRACLGTPHEFM
jgi:hypothetical protein